MALVVAKRGVVAAGLMMAMVATAESLGTYYWDGASDGDYHSAWDDNYQHWKLGSKTGPAATSIPSDEYDYVVGSGQVRTPQASATENTEVVLAGHSLTLNGGQLLIRNTGASQKITFNNGVTVANATIGSWNTYDADIYGTITVPANGICNIFESSAIDRGFVFHDQILGSGSIRLYTRLDSGSQSGKNFIATFDKDTLSEFTGTITSFWRQSYNLQAENLGYSQTVDMKGGNFPGTLVLKEYSALKLEGPTTIAKLSVSPSTTLNFADPENDGETPILEVTDELTLSDGVKFVRNDNTGETLSSIISGINASGTGSYTSRKTPAVGLRMPEGMTADLTKLVPVTNDPVAPGYELVADGRDYRFVPLSRYVLCKGKDDSTVDTFGSGTWWSDGQVPNDPDCGYIINGITTRTKNKSSQGHTAFNTFEGGALITSGNCKLIDQSGGMICDDLRVMSGSLKLSILNGQGSVQKFWDYDLIVRKADGTKNPAIEWGISYAGCFGVANNAILSVYPYALRCAADLQANVYGTGSVSFGAEAQNSYIYGSPVYRVSGDNSKFYGRFSVANSFLGAQDDFAHIYFTRREAFGGDRPTAAYDNLQMDCNTVLHIPTTMTVDQQGLGVYLTGSANTKSCGHVEFNIADGAEFRLKENLRLNNALWKTGAGTLALGGAKPVFGTSGVTTPTIGTNVLHIAEGGFKPLSVDAVDGLEVSFAEGTHLELEAVADISDGLGKYGMINTKWSTPFVLPEGGLVVKLVDPKDNLSKQGAGTHRIAIATVGVAAAGTLRDLLALDASELPEYDRVELYEESNDDETVTFSAVLRRGCIIFVK